MAQKVQVLLVDDLDGGKAEETVEFGIDGTTYEIDLSKRNAAKLRDTLSVYVAESRKVGRKRSGRKARSSTKSESPADVRAWALENGYEVSERGRVPQEIKEAYAAAH